MRNIKLLYIIKALYYSWFWLGIWVLYYLKFGGFSIVGILELVMIVSTIVFEIPTGAIGDLLGKRKTIIFACIFAGLGQIWMGFATNLTNAILSLVLLNLGGALISGTFEAMIFDSLKEEKQEKQYMKIISNMTAVRLISLAVAGVIGGYLYSLHNSLPYIVNGTFELLAVIAALFLFEPKIDSEKFSLRSYLRQNLMGLKQLFINRAIVLQTTAMLAIMLITLVMYEGVNDILSVKLGFSDKQLGILASVFALVSAGASVATGKISEKMSRNVLYFLSITIYMISLLISPFVGMMMGGFTILLRNLVSPAIENFTSVVINENTESQYRATTLSSFSMLASLPYALLIIPITASIDYFPASWIAFSLGVVVLFAGMYNYAVFKNHRALLPG